MTRITNELIYEVLKNVQADISELKSVVVELKEGQIGLRGQLHAIQGDALRQERTVAVLQLDIDRIKNRLDLADA
ncbi:MAG: hypothetical protein AB2826_19480 [Candidatus Thiodiazotropha sp.]